MLNPIGIAFGFEAGKILGGPNWLELDRCDVSFRRGSPRDGFARLNRVRHVQ
jgi:hypothetical protein